VHYRAVHLHPFYARRTGVAPAALPVATDQSARTLTLPLGPALTDGQQELVVATLREALQPRARNGATSGVPPAQAR
jgi:dTDP-4-amino-4,6-dideoxygalactose transaminase